MGYLKGILALFILLMILLYLVPGSDFKKYIRFFAEIILAIGFLSPVLNILYDSDKFLAMIDYEQFLGQMSELSKDMQRMEYMQQDYYLKEYERAIEGDVTGICEQHDFVVKKVNVNLNETYTLDSIHLTLEEQGTDGLGIDPVWLDDTDRKELYINLKEELSQYYQIDEGEIEIIGE